MHHEGRVGDFARTGLLYIIEAAYTSGDLEKWIVESDLATLMASGLGALYSQLSRLFFPQALFCLWANLIDDGFQKTSRNLSDRRSSNYPCAIRLFLQSTDVWG